MRAIGLDVPIGEVSDGFEQKYNTAEVKIDSSFQHLLDDADLLGKVVPIGRAKCFGDVEKHLGEALL